MDMVNEKNAEETYSKYHKDTLIEEYLQKRTSPIFEKILVNELEKRGVTLEVVEKFVKENKLNEYPTGLTYASLSLRTSRVMAYLIDSFYIVVAFLFLSTIGWIIKVDYGTMNGIAMLVYLIYFLIKDALPNGQSLGKKSMQIKVVSSTNSKNCTVVQSIIRNAVNFIPFVNVADALFAGRYKRQRIGDLLAGTIVIDDVSK